MSTLCLKLGHMWVRGYNLGRANTYRKCDRCHLTQVVNTKEG